jgi:hypothetical protein
MPTSYATKIVAVADASKEFLTVVVGLALAYAIATRGPEIPGIKTGSMTIWCSEVFALGVYILYASRFYINNWIYLSESYDKQLLEGLRLDEPSNKWKARMILARVYFDLILSVYTAILISFSSVFGLSASGNLDSAQWHNISWWLMICLMAHYVVDSAVLFGTIVISHNNTLLNRMRSSLWIVNNLIFVFIFALHLHDVDYSWLLFMVLWNCVIAIVITGTSPLIAHGVGKLNDLFHGTEPLRDAPTAS